MLMLERVRQQADAFDFMHFHLDYYPFSLFSRQRVPFVTTLHGRLDLPEHQPVFTTFSSAPVISISDAQRRPIPQAGWVRTIHHGLPQQLLTPLPVKRQYFAFLGRIATEKGVDRAISIARQCGVPLRIAAKVDKEDREYFDEVIRPLLDGPGTEYVGEITDSEKSEFLSGAIALLAPIDWPEPFGLVMIEAMACGTPVIAFNRGSVPEVVDDGLTGFIVEDEKSAIGAFDRLWQLSHQNIRRQFEKRFTARRMAQEYLAVYRSLADRDDVIFGWSSIGRRRYSRRKRASRAPVVRSNRARLALRPGFRHQRPQCEKARDSYHRQSEECGWTAESIAQIPGISRAHRSADSDGSADESLPQIEVPSAPRKIGDDERYHDGEYGRGNAVEQLCCNQQIGVRHRRE
jgi:Glycosyl transferases group 1